MTGAPLTAERIRQLVAEQQAMAGRLRGRRGRQGLEPPPAPAGQGPDAAFAALREQIDARVGAGATAHLADVARLTELLSILAQGSLEEGIERSEAAARAAASAVLPEPLTRQLREAARLRVEERSRFTAEEVEAVLACLDVLEKGFPLLVSEVRRRHSSGEGERLDAPGDPVPASSEDGAPLTAERIHRVLALAGEIAPGSVKVQRLLGAPSVYPYRGLSGERALGRKVVKDLAKRGEDADAFLEDVVRIRMIAGILRSGETLDSSRERLRALSDPAVWRNPYEIPGRGDRRAKALAAGAEEVADLQAGLDRGSEDAVREALPAIQRLVMEWRRLPGTRRG